MAVKMLREDATNDIRRDFMREAELLADWQHQALLPKIAALLVTVIAGAGLFAASGILLHIEELKELRDAFKRRLQRLRS